MVALLREDPSYLTRLGKVIPYAKSEEFVQMIMFSIFSDLFLVREELLLLQMIKSIIHSSVFTECRSAPELLRANSLVTKILAGYTRRRSAKLHLSYILKEPIMSILATDDYIELDPIKVYESLRLKIGAYVPEDLESHPEIKKVITNSKTFFSFLI